MHRTDPHTPRARRARRLARWSAPLAVVALGLILVLPAMAGSPCYEAKKAQAKAAKAVAKALAAKTRTAQAVADDSAAIVELNEQISKLQLEKQKCPPGEPAHTACINRLNKKINALQAKLAATKAKLDQAKSDDADAQKALDAANAAKAAADAQVASIPGCS